MIPDQPKVGDLLGDIKDDVRKVVVDEVEMGRTTLARRVESAAPKLGVVVLGASVALIGLAMLCVTLAFAFRSTIASPAICTLIAAAIFIVAGGAAAAIAAKRLGAHHQKATVH
ncbi:MAG TPA: phage holin family protein [Kofleriaceae bacterium]